MSWSTEPPFPFAGVISPPLPGRLAKPRKSGVTMILDKGLGVNATADVLSTGAAYIDYWKLTFGTSYFYPELVLREKIGLLTKAGIPIYPGGTFLEVAVWQDALAPFLDRCVALGFTAMEVSDGTVPLSAATRRQAISMSLDRGLTVLTEVGKKDPSEKQSYQLIHEEIEADVAAGAAYVTIEGRESGLSVGIYNDQGGIQEEVVAGILDGVSDPEVVLWEAPQRSQQDWLIRHFGPNVNLANIPPGEVVALEALRGGLRSDTLRPCLDPSWSSPKER
ncbi:MAG: phosphosulfolactate synthase [Sulfobacillus sp.]